MKKSATTPAKSAKITRKFVDAASIVTLGTLARYLKVPASAARKIVEAGTGPEPLGKLNGEYVFTFEEYERFADAAYVRACAALQAATVAVVDKTAVKRAAKTGKGADKFVNVAKVLIAGETLTFAQIKARFAEAGCKALWKNDEHAVTILGMSCDVTLDKASGLGLYTWKRVRAPRSDRGVKRTPQTFLVEITTNGRTKVAARTRRVAAR